MPRNLEVARLLATFQLHDAALDDVVHVAVSEGSIFTFAVIYRAEDGLEEPNAEDARRRETAALRLAIAEARAQRNKALRAWCAFRRAETLNSRNELSGAAGVDT